MRPRTLKRRLVLAGIAGTLVAATVTTGVAKADGVISNVEAAYINTYGAGAVCATIAKFPTPAGVIGVVQGVMSDGFAPDSAVDIINASVATYCDEYGPLLQRVGAMARSELAKRAI